MSNTNWAYDKDQRIKRLAQLYNMAEEKQEHLNDQDVPMFDTPLGTLMMNTLRKIAEELGDIPRATTEQPEDTTVEFHLNGVNTDHL